MPQFKRLRVWMVVSCLLLGGGVVTPLYASGDVNVTARETFVEVGGRGIVTLRVDVENRGSQTQEWQETIELPQGWSLVSNAVPFVLAAGARDTRLIHVSVPHGTGSGVFPVTYRLQGRNDGRYGGDTQIQVRVDARTGAEWLQQDIPQRLLAGESYVATLQLKNTGNQAQTFRLSIQDDEGFAQAIEPATLILEPNASGEVQVSGHAPTTLDSGNAHQFKVIASAGKQRIESDVSIRMIERVPKGLGKYQTLPGEVRLRYTQERYATQGSEADTQQHSISQWQTEYQAAGSVDADGEHNVSVRLRKGGSSTATNESQIFQDEYQFGYSNDTLQVEAGHGNYHSSSGVGGLSNVGVGNGVGAAVTYSPRNEQGQKPLSVRAFGAQSREGAGIQEKNAGVEVQYRFSDQPLEIGASAVNKSQANKPTNTITSINAGWNGDGYSLKGEMARDKYATAQSLDANARWEDLSGNLSYRQAAPQFEGGNQDTRLSQGNINWQVNGSNRVELSGRKLNDNLNKDLTREIREETENRIQLRHTFDQDNNGNVALGYRTRNEQDQRPTPTTDRQIKSGFIEYNQTLKDNLEVQARLEKGKRTDKLARGGNGTEAQLSARWHPQEDWELGASYTLNDNLNSEGDNTTWGLNGRYRLDSRRELSGYWQRNSSKNSYSSGDSYQLDYTHRLKNRHSFNLSLSRSDNNSNTPDTTSSRSQQDRFMVEYAIPLDTPIRRRTETGSLRGQAYYADTQEPAQDMVVAMEDQYAMTDETGQFHFPSLLAKDYQLQLDASDTQASHYTLGDEGAALPVTIKPQREERVTLTLKEGAALQGSIQVFVTSKAAALNGAKQQANLVAEAGVGNILLELQPLGEEAAGRITLKRTTGSDGSFSFNGVPPGEWQLLVVDAANMPEHTRLEQTQFSVTLEQGATQTLEIRALPVEQSIQKTGPSGGFHASG